jgi:REP element-mobilizing transposase RayT
LIAGSFRIFDAMTTAFVTFCTDRRWILPERVPSIVLECCLRHNGTRFDLGVAVVMPDHVPMIFAPLVDQQAREVYSLAAIMDAVKGASAHTINKMHRRKGRVWQAESFDRVLRSSENLDAKIIYLPGGDCRGIDRRFMVGEEGICESLPSRSGAVMTRQNWASPSGQPRAAVPT